MEKADDILFLMMRATNKNKGELAKYLGITYQTLQKWCKDDTFPSWALRKTEIWKSGL